MKKALPVGVALIAVALGTSGVLAAHGRTDSPAMVAPTTASSVEVNEVGTANQTADQGQTGEAGQANQSGEQGQHGEADQANQSAEQK